MSALAAAQCAQALGLTLWVRQDCLLEFEAPRASQVARGANDRQPRRSQEEAESNPSTLGQLLKNIQATYDTAAVEVALSETGQLRVGTTEVAEDPFSVAGKRRIWALLTSN